MTRIFTFTFLLLILCSCSGEEHSTANLENHSDSNAVASSPAITETISKDTTASEEEGEYNEMELNYIISVAEGYNYDSLKTIALKTAGILHFKFDTLGRYYNKTKKRIILPENDEDEIWAGEYFLRRSGEDIVSIEMRHAYRDTIREDYDNEAGLDTTRMFVFATMYTDKQSADSLAAIIRTHYPATRVFPSRIFMGCMH